MKIGNAKSLVISNWNGKSWCSWPDYYENPFTWQLNNTLRIHRRYFTTFDLTFSYVSVRISTDKWVLDWCRAINNICLLVKTLFGSIQLSLSIDIITHNFSGATDGLQ